MSQRRTSAILSVSQLASQLRGVIEQGFPATVIIRGEVSNFSAPSSGHWYFTLKDDRSQIRCAMFRGKNQLVRFRPKNGDEVHLYCRLGFYEPRGDVQVLGDFMEPAGLGSLQQAFEQLKTRLAAEGLFDQLRKRPVPTDPQRIAVITSPTGAAIRDILNVLKRRSPGTEVDLYPVAVQGTEAAPAIVRALELANRLADTEVIILGRGGGSLEDLWPFNEESVARAIAASELPVISAVGHETDVTIADFVADLRAPTPSAAAELAVPDHRHHAQQLSTLERRLTHAMRRQLQQHHQYVQQLQRRLRQPERQWQQYSQRLDELRQRLEYRLQQQLRERRQQLAQLIQRHEQQSPERRLATQRQQLEQLSSRLHRAIKQPLESPGSKLQQLEQRLLQQGQKLIAERKERLGQQMRALHLVSPLATLERGYAIVQDEQGHVVQDTQQLVAGQSVVTRLGQGRFVSTVTSTDTEN
ncbi:exodeoxyribonuclease VII large subunit [Pokkaliibacter sp. CJK22405]|uniref:exodeoxyribonuclease VII large subunit n=1 Tax=Pokkaliibacter sp. CJK22405 TaxID=3384615 RepID=UPI003984FB3A